MKTLTIRKFVLGAACAAALCLCQSASAIPDPYFFVNDFAANNISSVTGNTGLGDDNLLDWLNAMIAGDAEDLPDPTTTVTAYPYAGSSVKAGDYLVLHYGVGSSGTSGTGGGLVAVYFATDQLFNVPANGTGANGTGGISFARLFDHGGTSVPDGGSTVMMLGMALTGLGFMVRRFKK